ncbi:MAG: hypothetical protein RI554_07065 [Trueperaceae bacterium]|nr:hypothetical protein [Trueperaceae bacterium]
MIRILTLATATAALALGLAVAQDAAQEPAPDATQTQTQTQRRIQDPSLDHDPATDPIRARAQQHAQDGDAATPMGEARGRSDAAGGMGARGDGTPGANHAAFAEALGMTPDELTAAVQGGATLQELATEAGVDLADLGRPEGRGGPQAGAGMHAETDGAMTKGHGRPDAERGGPGRHR